MTREIVQRMAAAAWSLSERQHWVITRAQLIAIGFTEEAIEQRTRRGRLHRVHAGVYAVGRRQLTREGHFAAAVLACGEGAALSDHSAGEHWQILQPRLGPLHVTVKASRRSAHPGIEVHRRTEFETTRHRAVTVTTAVCTIVHLAIVLSDGRLERAINEAVNLDLTDPERLRKAVGQMRRRLGARRVAALLDRDTYVVTDSRLEQRFLRLIREAGLPLPRSQQRLVGGRVDFYWPDLGLVVEIDSLRFHRTPSQQANDVLRDQQHAAAGITPLRFTHWQVFHTPDHVIRTLTAVMSRARAA